MTTIAEHFGCSANPCLYHGDTSRVYTPITFERPAMPLTSESHQMTIVEREIDRTVKDIDEVIVQMDKLAEMDHGRDPLRVARVKESVEAARHDMLWAKAHLTSADEWKESEFDEPVQG